MANQLDVTDTQIRQLKPRDKVYTKHYGQGFYVYVLPTGRKVVRYHYQMNGHKRKYELGTYVEGAGKLKELKELHNKVHFNRAHNHVDPVAALELDKLKLASEETEARAKQAQQEAEELAQQNIITFADVAEAFKTQYHGLKGGREPSLRTKADYAAHLNTLLPAFGLQPMRELPEERIVAHLQAIATDKPVMANRLFSTLSVLCTWAAKQKCYQIRKNPFAGIDKPGGKEQAKSRVLDFRPKHGKFQDKGELKQFWQWLDTINPNHAAAFKLILLTGMRPGEALGLEWEDVDADEIILPADKTKNKKALFSIPVTPKITAVLDTLPDGTGYLFPARLRGKNTLDAPVKPATLSRLLSKALANGGLQGIEPFTTHDLRRTCASHIGSLNYGESVGLLLNHSSGGVTARYNYADGGEKKRLMLNAWHGRLFEMVEGEQQSNVRAIRA